VISQFSQLTPQARRIFFSCLVGRTPCFISHRPHSPQSLPPGG
jgi:hypothetical protein